MNLNANENRAYRKAKWEHTITETSVEYVYEDGEVKVDEFGEPETKETTKKTKVFTVFRYNVVSQAQLEKNQYLSNVWNQDCTFTIKTYAPIDPTVVDRIIINDKAYTISNIYKDFNDSTAGMFNSGGYCTTYIGLKGAVNI